MGETYGQMMILLYGYVGGIKEYLYGVFSSQRKNLMFAKNIFAYTQSSIFCCVATHIGIIVRQSITVMFRREQQKYPLNTIAADTK